MKNILFFATIALIISACSNQNSKKTEGNKTENSVSFSNDMENASAQIPSWINEVNVNEGIAHSGKFSCMMDETREYSYAFQEILSNINKELPKIIIVKAWVYSTVPSPDASFIANIFEGGKSIWWNSGVMRDRVPKANEWTEIVCYFKVDKPVFPTSQIRIFVWNQNKLKFYIDDMDVTFQY
ncbi:MAG: hypothetical protein ACOYMF_12270 [Bacteroidales bacterium]